MVYIVFRRVSHYKYGDRPRYFCGVFDSETKAQQFIDEYLLITVEIWAGFTVYYETIPWKLNDYCD